MSFSLYKALGAAVLGAMFLGCHTIPESNTGLDINIANFRFEKTTAFETSARVTLRLTNETPDTMTLRGAIHHVTINDIKFGKIVSGEPLEIAPFTAISQDVTMHISHLRVITRLKKLTDTAIFNYQLESLVHLDNPRRRFRLEVSETLDLTRDMK